MGELTPPQEGSVASGHGGRAGDTVGCGRARRWICNVGGGRGSGAVVSLALALPATQGMGRSCRVDAEEEE